MTKAPVALDEVLKARKQLFTDIESRFDKDSKRFLIIVDEGAGPWPLVNERGVLSALQRNFDHALNIFRGGHEPCHLPHRTTRVLRLPLGLLIGFPAQRDRHGHFIFIIVHQSIVTARFGPP